MPSVLYNQISQTARDFALSYEQDRCGKDITALSATLSPTCRRYFAPESLLTQAPDLRDGKSNTEYEDRLQKEFTIVHSHWTVEIVDVTVDETARKAVVHAITRVTSKRGKEYPFEFMFTLFTTDDGSKVDKVIQFVDMGSAMQFLEDEKGIVEALQ